MLGGEYTTVTAHIPGHENRSVDLEQANGLPARMQVGPRTLYVDPTPCGEPGCGAWATVEATKTAWASDHPHRAARRMELGHTPFCPDHVPLIGRTWTAVGPIGEDELPLPGLPE
jgi:hypothetical protein